MEQLIAEISPELISAISVIIGACLVFISTKLNKYINSMDINETFKKDLLATNDQVTTSVKKIVAGFSENMRQKLADGKLDEAEIKQLQKEASDDIKEQIPDIEKRLEVHMTSGGKYIADTILGEIESGNKVTNL